MIELSYKQIGPGVYQKWNPVQQIRSTIWFHGEGDNRKMTVRHEQPKKLIADVLALNVERQNNFKGNFKGVEMYQGTSLPISVDRQIKAQCGFKPGQGYDEKKFKQIMNDRDNYRLKTVPGKI